MPNSSLFTELDRAADALADPVLTIGNFDGVHRGHRAIFERTRELADRLGGEAVAVTFSPHPVRFFRPDAEPFRLTTDDQKFQLIRETGIEVVVAVDFDAHLANLSPEDFVSAVIDGGLGAQHVVVGDNFAFGKDRAGTTDDLREIAGRAGIGTTILDEIEIDGGVVSSTRIREALRDGRVNRAENLLGRNYRLLGRVESGDARGRELGYPTANIAASNLVPGDGIYATYLHTPDESDLPAATSIGTRPTFEDGSRAVEAHAIDRDDLDLYGKSVELEFVEFLRPEREFDSARELVEQMERDTSRARGLLRE